MARGIDSTKRSPKKITIGDGSIRDLIKFLLGEKLPVKQGKRTISAEEIKKAVPAVLERAKADLSAHRGRKDVETYGPAYNPREDYKGTYKVAERPHGIIPIDKYTPSSGYFPESETGERMGEFTGATPLTTQRDRGRPNIDRTYGKRRYKAMPRRTVPVYPTIEPTEPVVKRNPTIKVRDQFDIRPSDPYEQWTDFYMGGPVKKKKKKRKMRHGGKIKKYAKGGGIRKPKYS